MKDWGGEGGEIEEALLFPRHLGYGWVSSVLSIIVESRALVVDTASYCLLELKISTTKVNKKYIILFEECTFARSCTELHCAP